MPTSLKEKLLKGQITRLKATNFSFHGYLKSYQVQSKAETIYFKQDPFE